MALSAIGVILFIAESIAVPRPLGLRSLETALRLREILINMETPDTIKISTTGLISISVAEENKVHILFEEYLPTIFGDVEQPTIESYIERKNMSRKGTFHGYHLRMVLPRELNNGIGE